MERQSLTKPRFLVFHPESLARRRMRDALEQQFGCGAAHEAASEAELRALDLRTFDLIFLDDADHIAGSTLIAEIRSRCTVPVVLMCDPARAARHSLPNAENQDTQPLAPAPAPAATPECFFSGALTSGAGASDIAVAELEKRMEQLLIKNQELERTLTLAEEAANTDPLTGLFNRRYFEQALAQRVAEALRYDLDLACVMIDLDGYKQFNDTFGHPMGDRILTIVGKVTAANLRAMDTAARYGGDEFVLLLPQSTVGDAHRVATRISKTFATASASLSRKPSGVSMSIGIASVRCSGVSSCEQLVSAADKALYVAKHAGRDRIVLSEPALT